jgi:hypothetical protein
MVVCWVGSSKSCVCEQPTHATPQRPIVAQARRAINKILRKYPHLLNGILPSQTPVGVVGLVKARPGGMKRVLPCARQLFLS